MPQELALAEHTPVQNVPSAQVSDGFAKHQSEKRVIRGRMIKQVDGRNTVDGQPFSADTELLVQDVAQVGQYFPEDGPPNLFSSMMKIQSAASLN